MKKKFLYVILITILVDLYTAFLAFIDYLASYKTIEIHNQESYIVKKLKNILKLIII